MIFSLLLYVALSAYRFFLPMLPTTTAFAANQTTNSIWNTAKMPPPSDDTTVFVTSSNLGLIIFTSTTSKKSNSIRQVMPSTSPPHTHQMTMLTATLISLSAPLQNSPTSTPPLPSILTLPSSMLLRPRNSFTFPFYPILNHQALFFRLSLSTLMVQLTKTFAPSSLSSLPKPNRAHRFPLPLMPIIFSPTLLNDFLF